MAVAISLRKLAARLSPALLLACVLSASVPLQSQGAPSAICRQIEAQLAGGARPAANAGETRRYDRAIRSQETELEKARAQARGSGCASLFASLKAHCEPIRSAISRMESNLASLKSTRDGMNSSATPSRATLLASLEQNGCHDSRQASTERRRDHGTSLFDRLFREREQARRDAPEPAQATVRDDPLRSRAVGNRRTLCVRMCDGYFFPIAYASSSENFARDERICQSRCPGTEVGLYHHRVPDEEPEQMVSVRDGTPYADLDSAFAYRQAGYSRPASCGCNVSRGFTVIAGQRPSIATQPQSQPLSSDALAELVSARLDPDDGTGIAPDVAEVNAAEPAVSLTETASVHLPRDEPATADLAVAKAVQSHAMLEEPAAEDRMADAQAAGADAAAADRRVRVVGPTFLPDPAEAISLRVRDRAPAR